jgi:asparagine synthetase B (glutamine-hydrolysing)
MYLEKTDRATMSASLEARVPFLDRAVAKAAEQLNPMDQTKAALRRLLAEEAPEVHVPQAKRGLSVDMESTVLKFLSEAYQYELKDPASLLHRWVGAGGCRLVAERCQKSPYLLYRVAMLGLWEDEFGGGSYTCL